MSVAQHRNAAVAVLISGVLALLVWGTWMGLDSAPVRLDRERLQGAWVATLVQATENNKREGDTARDCRVTFDGHSLVFENLIEGGAGRGTYLIDPAASPARIDMKLDAGWIIGLYSLDGDTLTLCLNAMTMPERLGVPSRARASKIQPGPGRYVYRFRRASPAARGLARL